MSSLILKYQNLLSQSLQIAYDYESLSKHKSATTNTLTLINKVI